MATHHTGKSTVADAVHEHQQQRLGVRPTPQGRGSGDQHGQPHGLGGQRLRRPGTADRRQADTGADEYGTGPLGPPGGGTGGGTGGGGTGGGTGGGGTGGGGTGGAGTGGTPPASAASKPPAAVAAVLATLPAEAAAALRNADVADAGSAKPLTAAGIDDAKICRRVRRGCKSATKLHVVLTKSTDIRLVFRKVRPGQRAKIVRVTTVHLAQGARTIRIKARGLGTGSYRLTVRTENGANAQLALRVLS